VRRSRGEIGPYPVTLGYVADHALGVDRCDPKKGTVNLVYIPTMNRAPETDIGIIVVGFGAIVAAIVAFADISPDALAKVTTAATVGGPLVVSGVVLFCVGRLMSRNR
jgi:hypothetical protein